MCYITNRKEKAKIAEKDLVVYKILDGKHNSKIYNHSYKKGVLQPRIKMKKEKLMDPLFNYPFREINKGYHFYVKDPLSNYSFYNLKKLPDTRIKKFLIPKGTRYFINRKRDILGEGVAEQIIML